MTTEDELLVKLERWLADRSTPPTIFEVIETGDRELAAAFILKGFRAAARRAVLARLERAAVALPNDRLSGHGLLRIMDGLAAAWKLRESEGLVLLGFQDTSELEASIGLPIAELSLDIIERLAILLDIFQSINILIPYPESADGWLRRPNKAPSMKGASALEMMLSGLQGLRTVRAYLLSQIHGG